MNTRFWNRVNKGGPVPTHKPELGPCWLWTGYQNHRGYGQASFNGKVMLTHRISFTIQRGRLPLAGMKICHHCDNPSCVRPDHLFEGTDSDNMRDAVSKGRLPTLIDGRTNNPNTQKTHCKNGHPFSPENTKIRMRNGKQSGRSCIICMRNSAREKARRDYVPHPRKTALTALLAKWEGKQ